MGRRVAGGLHGLLGDAARVLDAAERRDRSGALHVGTDMPASRRGRRDILNPSLVQRNLCLALLVEPNVGIVDIEPLEGRAQSLFHSASVSGRGASDAEVSTMRATSPTGVPFSASITSRGRSKKQ